MPSYELFRLTVVALLATSVACAYRDDMLQKRPLDISNSPVMGMQLAHLHHMKTGGTSLNEYIRCGVRRLQDHGKDVSFNYVTECATGMIERCLAKLKTDPNACRLKSSVAMNFCTSLANVEKFGWGESDKVTVLRDPIDRVWSMYRFRMDGCYNCMPIAEVYHRVENGTLKEGCPHGCSGVCIPQLFNHMTANLIGSSVADKINQTKGKWVTHLSDQQILKEALHNLRTQFAVVGMTHDMNTTTKVLGEVFPWLAHSVSFSDEKCSIEHRNQSPSNPCGAESLPPQPDAYSRKIIEKYNQLDIAVYKAAVLRFKKQKIALQLKSSMNSKGKQSHFWSHAVSTT